MKPRQLMFIAGEPSGDLLAAELIQALRATLLQRDATPGPDLLPLRASLGPRFFGAGGPRMAEAGLELVVDLTQHSVVGLVEVLRHYLKFRRLFHQLLDLACARQPDAIVFVDFSGFNRRFAHALRARLRARRGWFNNWTPKLVQFVSPQVWASRAARARFMARDLDLLLSIFPFEQDWYALRAPGLRVEFVGHPLLDRYGNAACGMRHAESSTPLVLLLPGSRPAELRRHLPVLVGAAGRMQAQRPLEFRVVVPGEALARQAREALASQPSMSVQVGGLAGCLQRAELALASTGTVTLECARFGVPTVALYITSWLNYQIAKRLIRVAFLAMPNLLAGEAVYPEFIQHAATPENLAREALDLLDRAGRREEIRRKLAKIIATLGGPGASRRAARVIAGLLDEREPPSR
jgi:lipid-A-disaccharide synthase